MSRNEYRKMQQSGQRPKRQVKEIPESARSCLKENAKAFKRMRTKPYFIKDNPTYFKQMTMK